MKKVKENPHRILVLQTMSDEMIRKFLFSTYLFLLIEAKYYRTLTMRGNILCEIINQINCNIRFPI